MALQVGLDDCVPLILGHVEEHPLAEDASHCHHAVDPAPALDAGSNDLLSAGQGRDAFGHGNSLAACGLDLGDESVGHLALRVFAGHRHADVSHNYLGALGCSGQGYGPSDSSARSGDRYDLAVKKCSHYVVLLNACPCGVLVDVRPGAAGLRPHASHRWRLDGRPFPRPVKSRTMCAAYRGG